MYLVFFAVIIVTLIYRTIIRPLFYWKERGVTYRRPLPILGNSGHTFLKRKSLFQQSLDFYNEFPEKRYNGIFQFTTPILLIRDLGLLKQIMVKDFDHFTDHNAVFSEEVDPMMGKQLFALGGQKWRDMRATLSPSFTSSKIRSMFVLMSDYAEKFTSHFEKKATNVYVCEMNDLYTRFTSDIIACIVFGYNCDSVAEPENEFFMMGKKVTSISGWTLMKFFLANMSPLLAKWCKVTFFSKEVTHFFRRVVKDNIEKREKDGIVRPDMIQLLMEARSGRAKHEEIENHNSINEGFATVEESRFEGARTNVILTDDDITAQALVFFFSGFDTVATLMCFMSYELALNVQAQKKLQAEVDVTMKTCNGKLTYAALLSMKYMDMVVSETLRKWPPGFQLDRVCVKSYEIPATAKNEKSLIVEKGTVLLLPIAGIQLDAKFYPNPEKFDPERFSDENKPSIEAFSFIPFGSGPRNCIASRFALLECKTLMFHLLSKFSITVVEKTPIPLVLSKKQINMSPDEGFWLGLTLRQPMND